MVMNTIHGIYCLMLELLSSLEALFPVELICLLVRELLASLEVQGC